MYDHFGTLCFKGLTRYFHVSAYLIELIGVDRFIKIEYYTKHKEILTPFRVFVTHILIWGLAVSNAILIVLGLLCTMGNFRIFDLP